MKAMFAAFTAAILVLCATLEPCEAQQAAKIPRVGFLAPQGRSLPLFDAFRQGLANLGYVEGRNVVIEARFAEGQYERFPELFAELVRLKVDVLAVTGAVTACAAKKAATDILIVFAVVVDPVGVSEALMKASEQQAQLLGLQSQRLIVAAPNPDL